MTVALGTLATLAWVVAPGMAGEAAPAKVKESVRASTEEAAPAMVGEAARDTLAIGDPAPMTDVKMKNVDGREVSIAGVAGKKGTLVVFTCNHCPWVKAWEKRLVEIGNGYSTRGIGVIAINSNDPETYAEDGYAQMQKRAKQRGMKYPYVVDATSDVARAFGATRTPEAFLFDAGGRLVYHGAIDDNAREPGKVSRRYLEDGLKALIEGREIAVRETKALGCSIKFRPRT
jgi:peroxiredoxin